MEVKNIATISRVQDTTMLMIKDEQSLKAIGTALSKLGAEGIKHVFNGAPLIGLGVASHDLLNDKTKEVGISDVAKETISAFSPLIAGYFLFNEAVIKKEDTGSYGIENMEKAIMGGALLSGGVAYSVIGAKSIGEIAARASWIRAMEQAAKTVTAGVRGARTMWRVAGKVKPQLGESVAKAMQAVSKMPGSGRTKLALTGGAALAVALTLTLHNSKDPYAEAVSEGLVDQTSGKLTPKFDQAFASQTIEKKKEMLDAVAYGWYQSVGIENPETAYENGAYEVYARNMDEAKKLQHAVNGYVDDFGGHGVTIVETALEWEKTVS